MEISLNRSRFRLDRHYRVRWPQRFPERIRFLTRVASEVCIAGPRAPSLSVRNTMYHTYAVAFVESRGASKVLWESQAGETAPYAAVPRVEREGQLRLRFQKEKAEKGPRSRWAGRYWTLGRDPSRGDGLSRRRFCTLASPARPVPSRHSTNRPARLRPGLLTRTNRLDPDEHPCPVPVCECACVRVTPLC